MFESSYPFAFFDYFRVPYAVRPELALVMAQAPLYPCTGYARWGRPAAGRVPCCGWERNASASALPASCQLGRYRLRDFTFFGHVAVGAACRGVLSQFGHGWHPTEQISDSAGHPRLPSGRTATAISSCPSIRPR